MTSHALLDLVAWGGHLAVFTLVLIRPERSPLVWPMGLLAFDFFAWNFADFGFAISGRIEWHWIDLGLSPFSPALALHLAARFVGQTRLRRATLVVFYVWGGALASVAWLAFVMQPARRWIASQEWSAVLLAMVVTALAVTVVWLVRHARRVSDRTERTRAATMIAAMTIGAALSTTDLWNDFGINLAPLANLGSLVSSSLLAVASLRLKIFGRNLPPRLALLAGILAATGVLGYAGLFRWLSQSTAAVMIGTAVLTLFLATAVGQLVRGYVERRDRLEALARQGRFSAQMAHDLKNPLAALKGAVQYLNEEANRGGSLAEQRQFLTLLVEQVDRIDQVVDGYSHLGRIQPQLAETDLNQVVRNALALQRFVRDDVVIRWELGDDLPPCQIDRDLVSRAVENLVRNSTEAMPLGGVVAVRTSVQRSRGRTAGAFIIVEDTGDGMDARQSARAFDDFFTTKPQGSGLGLAFIKRVMQAHGGRVELASKVKGGTSVTLYFPINRGRVNGRAWLHPGSG